MKNFIHEIDNIISDSNNQINDKIIGLNYLERLKYLILDKIEQSLIDSFKITEITEISKKYQFRNLLIKIIYYPDSTSKIKQILENDRLILLLNGFINLDISQNKQVDKSSIIKLYKKTGIVLSKDTVISENISKESLLIEIIYIDDGIAD